MAVELGVVFVALGFQATSIVNVNNCEICTRKLHKTPINGARQALYRMAVEFRVVFVALGFEPVRDRHLLVSLLPPVVLQLLPGKRCCQDLGFH